MTMKKMHEKIEYAEYKFKNKREAQAAAKFFNSQQRMGFFERDDEVNKGIISVEVDSSQKKGDFDMTPYHNAIVKKLKPKVLTTEAAIDDLRKIVKTKSIGKVAGQKVDLFSASAMVQVYDALNDKNRKKVDKMLSDKRGVLTFADFAMSQMK